MLNRLHNPIQDTMVGISPSEIVSEDEKQFSIEIPNSPMKKENGDPDPELYNLLNEVEEHIQRVLTSFTLSRKKPFSSGPAHPKHQQWVKVKKTSVFEERRVSEGKQC